MGGGELSIYRSAQFAVDQTAVDRVRETRAQLGIAPNPASARPSALSSRESLLALAAEGDSSITIRFHIALEEPGFDFALINTDDLSARGVRIDERVQQLRPAQETVERAIVALGGRVTGRLWLVNQLMVEAPKSAVPSILRIARVTNGFEEGTASLGTAYNGYEARAGSLAATLHTAGYYGDARGRTGTTQRIRIGVSEFGRLNTAHVGFLDYGGGPTRIARYAYCASGVCTNQSALPVAGDYHPTYVASVAIGSIDDYQDINFWGYQTPVTAAHSGIAPKASLYYYQAAGGGDIPLTIQQAVADGVDVYSGSWTITCGATCNPGSSAKAGALVS